MKVLIVDDNEASAKTMGWTMEMLEHEVQVVASGAEALQAVKSFIPDIAVLDIGMPVMDGYELCRLMRQEPSLGNTAFIALTGWGRDEDRNRTKEAGFNFHLVKPVDFKTLEKLIESLKQAA